MKTHIILVVFILSAIACHTTKSTNKSNQQQSNTSDSSSKLKEVIEESIDTAIKTPEKRFEFELSSNDTGVQKYSTPDFDLTIKNSGGKSKVNLNLKAKEIPVKLNRKTTRESQVKTHNKSNLKSNQFEKEKTSEGFKIPWWVWVLITAIGFIYLSFKAQYS